MDCRAERVSWRTPKVKPRPLGLLNYLELCNKMPCIGRAQGAGSEALLAAREGLHRNAGSHRTSNTTILNNCKKLIQRLSS